ncbi:hypothetical protein [Candidatus Poriferisodalis sp.]|uniref:hypothetical protein n=1 Tax=Candidatus Poriferisodalis sp. TaxID=3101277 RepID=UPI003B02B320
MGLSAVGHGLESRADLLASVDREPAQSGREDGLRHGGKAVECGETVVIDPFVGADSFRDYRLQRRGEACGANRTPMSN